METFEVQFREKLKKLTNSQQSIESLSLWIIYHSKYYKSSVKIWKEEIEKVSQAQQLTLLYVCNDVIQNSRKKTQNFINEFSDILPNVLEKIYPNFKEKKRINRIFDVWKERNVFQTGFISKLKSIGQPKEHYLIKYLNLNQNYNSVENFNKNEWENRSIEEIKKKINEEEMKKKKLTEENQVRENYINDLEKEIQIQKSLKENVSNLILNSENNLNFLKNLQSNQKRTVEQMNFENLNSKKYKISEQEIHQLEWDSSSNQSTNDDINHNNGLIQPIDVTTIESIVNALDDQKEESSLDLFLNE
eukprot:gene4803-8389_t